MTTIFDMLLSLNSILVSKLASIDILSLILVCFLMLALIPIFYPVVRGIRCPNCLHQGVVTWVLPGRNCPRCGQPC